tara:strand:+ start:2068 stop:2229 length:162 start_codon:yes stop_codon:yes gene_type:complete
MNLTEELQQLIDKKADEKVREMKGDIQDVIIMKETILKDIKDSLETTSSKLNR